MKTSTMTSPVAQSPEEDRPLAWDPEPARVKRTVRSRPREQDMAWNQGLIQRRIFGPADRWELVENPDLEAWVQEAVLEVAWAPVEAGVRAQEEAEAAREDKKYCSSEEGTIAAFLPHRRDTLS
jgi:hypothetical protein